MQISDYIQFVDVGYNGDKYRAVKLFSAEYDELHLPNKKQTNKACRN